MIFINKIRDKIFNGGPCGGILLLAELFSGQFVYVCVYFI